MASDRPPPSRTKFYGFLGGDTRQWHPDLVYDNHAIEPPRTPEQGYQLSEDLADRAIESIPDAKQVAPNKTFYLHFRPAATHAPHHVAKQWADRYQGLFDDGWDAYRERVFARQKKIDPDTRNQPACRGRLCRSTHNKEKNPSTPLTNAAATAAPAQLARRTAIPTARTRQSTMSPRRSMISGICRLVVDRRGDPDRTEFRDHSTQAADQRRFIC